jgi:8-oxo-dGTP pyrophosphatase MutT (NUDIX family)
MKPVMQLLHRARRLLFRLTGWKTRGVKVMLFNRDGELLLVRNSYGKSHLYVLPGGGIRSKENPQSAAAREVEEEVGIRPTELVPFATYVSELEGRRDTIHLFTARADAAPKIDGLEVEEARFFPLDRLPETVSDATLRRIAEYRGEAPVSPRW